MTILQALTRQYDRLTTGEASDRRPPRYGYSLEKIAYAIVLSPEGDVLDVQPLLDTSGKKPRPSPKTVPQAVVRSSGIISNFLWDKTAYVFGVKRNKNADGVIESIREHECFRNHNSSLLRGTDDDGLKAFLKFLEAWRPERFDELVNSGEMLDTNVVFRLESQLEFLHEHPAAYRIWLNHLALGARENSLVRQCLVTGEIETPKKVHAKIKGVRGTHTAGAPIVSFNLGASSSYGKAQGENAPVSHRAAFAYTTALNHMLRPDSGRSVLIGDTATVFWAETAGDEAEAERAESLFSMILEPSVTDDTETAELSKKLESIAQGRPLSDIDPKLNENSRFYVLGLAPNASRLSIRFWIEDSFGNLAKQAAQHFEDLRIEPVPWKVPPAPWRLLLETAAQRKGENIQPTLSGTLLRSILEGGRYPQSLFGAVIARIRADKKINGMRAAICKAFLARNFRLGFETEDIPMSLDKRETNAAYRLGRMFAVYENIQEATRGGSPNATIKDQYFGAASATPGSVFPIIARKAMHHLASIRKDGKGGLAHWFEGEVESILDGMGTSFPKSLRLEDQGRFAIGYYHQKSSKRNAPKESEEPISPEDKNISNEH